MKAKIFMEEMQKDTEKRKKYLEGRSARYQRFRNRLAQSPEKLAEFRKKGRESSKKRFDEVVAKKRAETVLSTTQLVGGSRIQRRSRRTRKFGKKRVY